MTMSCKPYYYFFGIPSKNKKDKNFTILVMQEAKSISQDFIHQMSEVKMKIIKTCKKTRKTRCYMRDLGQRKATGQLNSK